MNEAGLVHVCPALLEMITLLSAKQVLLGEHVSVTDQTIDGHEG